jgi:glycosyltransferase involved in cell wall biosynthesis
MARLTMRVLLTTESYLPYLSGVTVSVDALARGLGLRGHEVLVLAPRPQEGEEIPETGSPGPPPRYAWLPSYELRRLVPPRYRMPWPHPGAPALVEARRFAPDIVHAHSPFVSGQLARSVARGRGVPLVFTHHTRFTDYGHYLGPLARPGSQLAAAWLRRWWAACDAIIAPSSDLAGEIAARLPTGSGPPVRVIPTGIDVDGIRVLDAPDLRASFGWGADSVVVASLGRLAPEKSPMLVLEAIALARRAVPQLRLIVIGDGPSADALRRRALEPDLAGTVAFVGRLPRVEALRRLRGADLFMFASRTETQGLVLAEALAAGLPSMAVDGPGVRDSVRDGVDGVIVAHGEPTDVARRLAEALAGLAIDGTRRREMATRALEDATRFAVGARVADTEELYVEVRESMAS